MTTTPRQIRIEYADLGDIAGAWDPDTRIIWLHTRLTAAQRRSTLAHEAVHAYRGDERIEDPILSERQERIAERIAARLLITLEQFAEALRWCRDDHELAEELHVDVDILTSWRGTLTPVEKAFIEDRLASIEHAA